jgi:hypothetical protein
LAQCLQGRDSHPLENSVLAKRTQKIWLWASQLKINTPTQRLADTSLIFSCPRSRPRQQDFSLLAVRRLRKNTASHKRDFADLVARFSPLLLPGATHMTATKSIDALTACTWSPPLWRIPRPEQRN